MMNEANKIRLLLSMILTAFVLGICVIDRDMSCCGTVVWLLGMWACWSGAKK